jgi:hypothetical protein
VGQHGLDLVVIKIFQESVTDDPVVDVAQIRTVTTLRIIDKDRKIILLQFLRDANLANFILANASLNGANPERGTLVREDMRGAQLEEAVLSGAFLGESDLSDAT